MTERRACLSIAAAVVIALAAQACGTLIPPTPTPTPEPSATPTATATDTPTPTPTATPTPTRTPKPEVELGELMLNPGWEFSFRRVKGYEVVADEERALISNPAAGTAMTFGILERPSHWDLELVLNDMLSDFEADLEDFQAGDPHETSIAGLDGLSMEFSGILGQEGPIGGRLAGVSLGEGRFFVALGSSTDSAGENQWQEVGSAAFEAMLATVSIPPQEVAGECPVAEDASYGYSQDNPIQVGGGTFGGPSREDAYLEHLRGPAGQPVTYERTGSLPYGDTILDAYAVSHSGLAQPLTLYIDEYSFAELMAPQGFTCEGPFPLQAP